MFLYAFSQRNQIDARLTHGNFHLLHISSRAVIKNPKLLSVVEDVFCQDYVSGEGHEFFTAEEFEEHWQNQDIGTKRCRKSLIAWAVPKGEAISLPDCLDIMGDFPTAQSAALAENTRSFTGCDRLETLLGLGALRPLRQSEGNLFLRASTPLNTVIFRGMQYTQKDGAAARITQLNTGHWGKNVSRRSLLASHCTLLFSLTISLHAHSTFNFTGLRRLRRTQDR